MKMKTRFLGNKGQGAMEYLMTYGWAILVVMIVGVVLWQLGVFNIGTENIVVTGFSKLKPLPPSVAYTASIGNFTASFTNTIGTSIRISTRPTIVDQLDGTVTWSAVDVDGGDPTASSVTVAAGDAFQISSNDGTAALPSGSVRNPGDPFDLEITIVYTSVMGGISTTHTDTGRIRGPIEA
ncbi:MAG: hypothetical protein U9Q22_04840 [Candidatus Altiarchaeota archaeon]|nr:hypothetical protein [Candidatus Altiarchaeota archaeon]